MPVKSKIVFFFLKNLSGRKICIEHLLSEHSLKEQPFVLMVKLQTFSIAFPFRLLLYCQKIDHQLFTFSYFSIMATMHLFDEF